MTQNAILFVVYVKSVLMSLVLYFAGTVDASLVSPKPLGIGASSYVRKGFGNQLVRDSRTIARAFASEKVRWSLHNARLRRAKKSALCVYYTRFGVCKRGDGKCLYIHDPEKVAVCTKFLRGSCSDAVCRLTHKVRVDFGSCVASYFFDDLGLSEYDLLRNCESWFSSILMH